MIGSRDALVAFDHFGQNILMVCCSTARDDLVISSLGAFFRSRIQIDFQVCIRQDDRPDIASNHHNPSAFPDAPLLST